MSVQEEKFKEIANAIRPKLGTTELIEANNFAKKVGEIKTPTDGSIPTYQGSNVVYPSQSGTILATNQNYLISDISVRGDQNFRAENIKKDVIIWGVTGTLEEGGKLFINGNEEKFKVTNLAIPSKESRLFFESNGTNYWYSNSILYFILRNELYKKENGEDKSLAIFDNNLTNLCVDSKGLFHIFSDQNHYTYNINDGQIIKKNNTPVYFTEKELYVYDGKIICTSGYKIWIYQETTDTWISEAIPSYNVKGLAIDKNGFWYYSTESGGKLEIYKKESGQWSLIFSDNRYKPRAMMLDENKNVYVVYYENTSKLTYYAKLENNSFKKPKCVYKFGTSGDFYFYKTQDNLLYIKPNNTSYLMILCLGSNISISNINK